MIATGVGQVYSQGSGDFIHPSDVVSRMKKVFKEIKTYKAGFRIATKEGTKTSASAGSCYYKQGGKLNFTFSSPYGDKIISDGKKMWVYIASLRAVGIQNFEKKTGNDITSANSYEGLVSLFRRYHYRFNSANQPVTENGRKYFTLKLKEKTTSGGYQDMLVFVDAQTYLIHKIEAESSTGKVVNLTLSNIELNTSLPESLFSFKVEGNMKVVENALTTQ